MDNRSIRPRVWLAVVGTLAILFLVLAMLGRSRTEPAPQPQVAAPVEPAPAEKPDSRLRTEAKPPRAAPAATPEEPPQYIEGLVYGDIDLREARELMPDNMYWKLGAPTKDPQVLAEREEERKRRNEEYGRVLAGDASEDEVREYYDYRKRLSSDYLEFSEFMARRHKGSGPEQFVSMLELATKMHADRLAQLPAQLEDALQRAREREKIREDWRRQQEEFGELGGAPPPDEDSP